MVHSPHIEMAQKYWQEHLKPKDLVIDATCGNGHDTLFLSNLVSKEEGGAVIGFDLQEAAIQKTQERLKQSPSSDHITLYCRCHSEIDKIPLKQPPKLVVYNLGYLPGAKKDLTTQTQTTLQSILRAIEISDALSITCYPGHVEGEKEEKAILELVSSLSSKEWLISHHTWVNRPKSPSLFWMART